MAEGYANYTFRAECGHEVEVSVAGKNLAGKEFTCGTCGSTGVLKPDQVVAIEQALQKARAAFIAEAKDRINAGFKATAARNKGITYRRKR